MDINTTTFLIVCPLVFLAALIDSIAGGGGIISLPAYMAAGVPPHYALGCNKLSSFMGTIISTFRYVKNGAADLKIAPASIVLALAGSAIGANIALFVDEAYLKGLLIFVLPIVAFCVLRKDSFTESEEDTTVNRKQQVIIALAASFIIGGYDGFYGPGTGTFLILILTGLAKMDIRNASGNTKLVNLASNLAALVTFMINGKVLFLLSITAGVFGIAGNYIGSGLVLKGGTKVVKPIMLLVLFLLFIKIVTE
ncbi:sulfite exporter TauE/SafE family protein [Aminipila sp.]|uniref:sulfite exporter TauE/SafE family protein n=1 Tax=Aminipila sp. TaxID=2060095 RepID=UPI00289AFBFF|nr:TSUP family transporter [Aminipila sp.]